jgi:hypothetical protein
MQKGIAFMLVIVMLLSTGFSGYGLRQAYAATKAQKVIEALDIMETDQGNIDTDAAQITRAQYAQLLVNMSSLRDSVADSSNVSLFSDVSKKYWAAGYIKTAVSNGWMYGYLDGSFKPKQGVTLIEAVTGVLKLLGYTDSDFSGNVTGNKMALYHSKKLNNNISTTQKTAKIGYTNCVNLFYNVLNAKAKDGKVYAETLGYSLDEGGELDYLSVVNTNTEGPIISNTNWTSKLPFTIAEATYYKNDVKATYADIDNYDVLYYSESSKTIWAYDKKVTGVLSAISPDLINPTSVTVAGGTYSFETSEATQEFSSVGSVSKGDIVTLLLGKNNAVVGVLTQNQYNTTIAGVVLSTGVHRVEDANGIFVNTSYATFVDAAGNQYEQDYDDSKLHFIAEDIIVVRYEDGKVKVSEADITSVSLAEETFNSTGTFIGGRRLASDVKILDYSHGKYISVYPARLSDMTLLDGMLLYYDTNVAGEIEDLILYNATGDIDTYGIFTGMSYANSSSSYNYIIDGTAGTISKPNLSNFSTTNGPTGFSYENNEIIKTYELYGVVAESIGMTSISSGMTKYPIAEKLSVYYLSDDKYTVTSLDKIKDLSKYKVTAYRDKAITLGGRIRVIVAESITK